MLIVIEKSVSNNKKHIMTIKLEKVIVKRKKVRKRGRRNNFCGGITS